MRSTYETGPLGPVTRRTIGEMSAEYRRILGLPEPDREASTLEVTATEAGLLLDLRQAWATRPGEDH